jgi:GNAT superfamily N-acetyltransferase
VHLETLGHMKVICEFSEKHIEQLRVLYQGEWWTRGRSLEDTRKCVLGSQLCIGIASENDDLTGFVRVLTDFTFKALIFDVIVAQSERGKGIGNKMLSLVKNHEHLKSVRHFELYCLPEMLSFYEKHGFSANVGEIKLMRLTNA